MEQCILADEVGFDYLWFVEHHFLTGFSASPCPDLVYAALSQRTKQIRLGLGVVILPYHHPNRVAERVAMLDHLSEGRVDFGTGRSAPYELTGMGIDPRDSREMWEESLSMVPNIWQTDWYSYEGKYWQVPERQILPKPYQDPHPPIWGCCPPAGDIRDCGIQRHRGAVVRLKRAVLARTVCQAVPRECEEGESSRGVRQRPVGEFHSWRMP